MLSELCRHFPEVRRQFDLTDRASLSSAPADRPARMVYPLPSERGDADSELFHLEWAVESVAAANRALFALVQKLKIDAHAAVGHSSGEFVALWAAGALDIDDESELVKCIADGTACTREIIERDLVPPAVLTTVGGVPRELVEQIVAEVPGLEIAMDNCPNQLVIVGDEVSAGTGVEMLRKKGAICQRFPWDRAYHTESFRAASEPLSRYIESIPIRKPSLELWSCSTAAPYPTDAESIRELAVRQWSTPVRFRSTVDAMYDAGVRVFVEVGPRGNLTAFIRDSLKGRPHLAVALNVPRGGELAQLTQALAMLAAHGVELDLEYLSRRRTPRMLDFDLAPPPPATRDPVLRLDLPELEIDSAVLTAMHSSAPPADGNGFPETRATATPKSTPHSVNGGYDEKERALADYQKTMREFLALQERMMTLSKNQTPPHE